MSQISVLEEGGNRVRAGLAGTAAAASPIVPEQR